jgi:hypothetical protein
MRWWILKNFKIFKNEKILEIVQKAHKTKKNEKIHFQNFWFCALFRQFPTLFDFSKNFENF